MSSTGCTCLAGSSGLPLGRLAAPTGATLTPTSLTSSGTATTRTTTTESMARPTSIRRTDYALGCKPALYRMVASEGSDALAGTFLLSAPAVAVGGGGAAAARFVPGL